MLQNDISSKDGSLKREESGYCYKYFFSVLCLTPKVIFPFSLFEKIAQNIFVFHRD